MNVSGFEYTGNSWIFDPILILIGEEECKKVVKLKAKDLGEFSAFNPNNHSIFNHFHSVENRLKIYLIGPKISDYILDTEITIDVGDIFHRIESYYFHK